ncbi:MAG TPA: hypothetical protein VKB49_23190 [Candidatus Sulfotelmatobacter sp.]|nr:hypothetical protein [Candidatus Sulfotelmatobacter sp.]
MQRFLTKLTVYFFVLLIAGTWSVAQDFKPYPGSRFDDKASQQASAFEQGMEVQVYRSGDNFEKIYSFYKSLYREVAVPFPKQMLPDGKEVKWAFFVLDGGKDLMHSNYWMKVQRPYIGAVDDEANFEDVRDISVIQTVHRHGAAIKRSRPLDIRGKQVIGFGVDRSDQWHITTIHLEGDFHD